MNKKQFAGALLAATLVFPPSLAFAEAQNDPAADQHRNDAGHNPINQGAVASAAPVSTELDRLADTLTRKMPGEYVLQTGTALARMTQATPPNTKLPFDVLQSEKAGASSDFATLRVFKTNKKTYLVLTLKGTQSADSSQNTGKSSSNYAGRFSLKTAGSASEYTEMPPLTTHDVENTFGDKKPYPKEILIPVEESKTAGKLEAQLSMPAIASFSLGNFNVVLEWKELKLDTLYKKSVEGIIAQANELAEQDKTSASDKAALKKVAEEATKALDSATKPEDLTEQITKLNDAINKAVSKPDSQVDPHMPQLGNKDEQHAPQAGSEHNNGNTNSAQPGNSSSSGNAGGSGGAGGSAGSSSAGGSGSSGGYVGGSGGYGGGSTSASDNDAQKESSVPGFDQATKRIAGETAEDTMQQIVKTAFPDPVKEVVLATSESYWDALSANSLAGSLNAPVLLTKHGKLPEQTIAELKRLQTSKVVVCGGENAISNDVVSQLKELNIEVERVAGNMASDTANDIAQKLANTDTAVVTTSWGYEDALSAASFAYAKKAPIFLANYNTATLDESNIQTMKDKGVKKVYIVGGTAVVSPEVEAQLSAAGIAVERVAGNTAYDTSAKLATKLISLGMSANNMAIATGWGYTDALAGAALCGKQNSVMVLADNTNQTAISEVVAANKNSIKNYYIFGGTSVVGEGATDALKGVFTGKDAK